MLLHTEDFKNWGIRAINRNLTQIAPSLNLTLSVLVVWRAG
jgi:hypothetical protein